MTDKHPDTYDRIERRVGVDYSFTSARIKAAVERMGGMVLDDLIPYGERYPSVWEMPDADPLGDLKAMADAVYRSAGVSLDEWSKRSLRLGFHEGRRKIREYGGTPPLERDERAAYWRRILAP